jgi:hypothetical protein
MAARPVHPAMSPSLSAQERRGNSARGGWATLPDLMNAGTGAMDSRAAAVSTGSSGASTRSGSGAT